MILMLETNDFADKDYRPVSECIKEINELYGIQLGKPHYKAVHRALQQCKWLKNKPAVGKNGKPSTKYYIRQLKKFNNPANDHIWDNPEYGYDYDKQYIDLGEKLEDLLGIKILQSTPNQFPTNQGSLIKNTEPQEKQQPNPTWYEPDVDGWRSRLKTEDKLKIKITEGQLNKLKSLLQ